MKAFCIALVIMALLVASVVGLSAVGRRQIAEYRDAVPAESAALTDAARALSALSERIEDGRLLLVLLFSHERCDELKNAASRCAAAARAEEFSEYAIQRAELLGLLEDMERDLCPGILDVL